MSGDYERGVRKRQVRVVYGYTAERLISAMTFWHKRGWSALASGVNKRGMHVASMERIYIKELKR